MSEYRVPNCEAVGCSNRIDACGSPYMYVTAGRVYLLCGACGVFYEVVYGITTISRGRICGKVVASRVVFPNAATSSA